MEYMKDIILGVSALIGGGFGVAVFTYLTSRKQRAHEVWSIERDSLHQDITYLREQLAELREEVAALRLELRTDRDTANTILATRDRAYWKVRDLLKKGTDADDTLLEIEIVMDDLEPMVGQRV